MAAVTPKHVAIIMDGNRRWAKQHGLQAIQGHQKVAREVIERLVDHCVAAQIPYLTLWAFSTENWRRDPQEVSGLMSLFRETFGVSSGRLHDKGVKIQTIGDLSKFSRDIQDNIAHWKQVTTNNTKITVTFALNYGGRDEIMRAMQAWKTQAQDDQEVSEALVSSLLDTAQMPDPDLIIRPGGEQRLSGFLTWQSVYAELYFTKVLMPDFGPAELDKALLEYQDRQRRFGG
jgi:undecaprenyl diphosphate synthase